MLPLVVSAYFSCKHNRESTCNKMSATTTRKKSVMRNLHIDYDGLVKEKVIENKRQVRVVSIIHCNFFVEIGACSIKLLMQYLKLYMHVYIETKSCNFFR